MKKTAVKTSYLNYLQNMMDIGPGVENTLAFLDFSIVFEFYYCT